MAPNDDTPSSSSARWIIIAMIVGGAGLGLYLAMADPPGSTPQPSVEEAGTPATAGAEASAPVVPAPPATRIDESGRLSVELESLREGDVMALALDLPDEARGDGALQVKVIDVSGRLYETESLPIEGAGNGLRLEIDPEWLRPGRYMIEVKTAERKPLALRRYVLEITSGGHVTE